MSQKARETPAAGSDGRGHIQALSRCPPCRKAASCGRCTLNRAESASSATRSLPKLLPASADGKSSRSSRGLRIFRRERRLSAVKQSSCELPRVTESSPFETFGPSTAFDPKGGLRTFAAGASFMGARLDCGHSVGRSTHRPCCDATVQSEPSVDIELQLRMLRLQAALRTFAAGTIQIC